MFKIRRTCFGIRPVYSPLSAEKRQSQAASIISVQDFPTFRKIAWCFPAKICLPFWAGISLPLGLSCSLSEVLQPDLRVLVCVYFQLSITWPQMFSVIVWCNMTCRWPSNCKRRRIRKPVLKSRNTKKTCEFVLEILEWECKSHLVRALIAAALS